MLLVSDQQRQATNIGEGKFIKDFQDHFGLLNGRQIFLL